ncbi:MAG: class I SAM-dependent methyltransferase [Thalassobaculaceae bacterium]
MKDENRQLLQRFAKAGMADALTPVVAAVEAGDIAAGRTALAGADLSGTDLPDSVGHRVGLAFQIAMRSIERLTETGAVDHLDFSAPFGKSPDVGGLALTEDNLQTLAKALITEGQKIVARRWPCPSCGGSGARVGAAPLMGRFQPYARLYFDLDAILAPFRDTVQASDLEWDTVVAKLLQHFNMRSPVVLCESCGLHYLDWEYDPRRIDAFYAGREMIDFTLDGVAVSGRGHSPEFVFKKLGLPLHVDAQLGGVAGKRVFDLGCAEGVMMEAFRHLGATVSGADLDRSKVAYAKRILDHQDIDERADALQRLAPGSVDTLVCYHTLEHLIRVGPWLDAMAAALSPGGSLVVSVPDVTVQSDGTAIEMGGDHWIGFNADTLRRHVEAAGLTVVDLRSDNGIAPLRDADPIFGLPTWSGRRVDTTVIARKP